MMSTTRMQRLLYATTLVLACTVAEAQMGIRYGIHFEKTTNAKQGTPLHLVLGWDFDFADRLSGGLDLSTDMNWASQYNQPSYLPANGVEYHDKVKVFGVQYRSQFHFSDNDQYSFYLGPTIGLRAIKQTITYDQAVDNYWNTRDMVTVVGRGMTFPIGLRLGMRGELDGGYLDLFAAVGTNLGSGEPIHDFSFLDKESELKRTFLQAGLCWGFGW